MASGRPLPGAAHRVRQQDGPHGRGLRARRRDDARPPRRERDPGAPADRRGGRLRRPRRPRHHDGGHLRGRPRHQGQRGSRSRTTWPGRGRGRPRDAHRGARRHRRRAGRGVPRGRGDLPGDAPRRDPQGRARPRHHPGAVRVVVQEQGRAAPARRGRRLPAVAARRAPGRGPRARQRRAVGASGGPERPVRGARVQGDERPVRRAAHVPARLLRVDLRRRVARQRDEGPQGARRAPAR